MHFKLFYNIKYSTYVVLYNAQKSLNLGLGNKVSI